MSSGISLIIPTYNGAHKVINALNSVATQLRMPDEVILVIDGSTDATREVAEGFISRIPQLRILEQTNQGRAAVRNTGARAARYDILFFLDDDMIMPEGCVGAHFEHHERLPGTIVCGRLDQKKEENSTTEFERFENWLNTGWNADWIPDDVREIELQEAYITANNFSISKADFVALGMFDPRLNDGEDYDLSVIAMRAGKRIFLSNACRAWHFDFSAKNFSSYIRRMRQYNKAQKQLVQLKPELHGNRETNKRYPPDASGVKALFFALFTNRFFVFSLDKGTWTFLPLSWRCKLYDYIITANGTYFPDRVSI